MLVLWFSNGQTKAMCMLWIPYSWNLMYAMMPVQRWHKSFLGQVENHGWLNVSIYWSIVSSFEGENFAEVTNNQ